MNAPSKVTRPADDTVVVERWFMAPPALIWTFWTDPAHMARWWAPFGMTTERVLVDAREGGAWEIDIRGENGLYRIRGRYLTREKPNRLVSTWAWLGDDGALGPESRYEVRFAADGDGTLLTLTHSGLPFDQADSHGGGWMSTLDSLERHAAEEG